MTTNHKDKLDPALLRPGRADLHIEFGNATASQIYRLFLKFYPNEEKNAQNFSLLVPEKQISMAQLQEHFIKFDAEQAIKNYKLLLKDEQVV